MGYYTGYSLKMYGPESACLAAQEDAAHSDNDCLEELFRTEFLDSKWYNFEAEFHEFARQHPDVLFIVDGDGEDSWDIWQERFKGDLCEYHEVIMPPFDTEELLTESEKLSRIMKDNSLTDKK